jgi:hypothetical protein
MIISEKHAVQHGEKARNSLGLNYKSAALDQLSYAGKNAAHRDDGKRFVMHADEKLTAFLELEKVTRESSRFPN